MASIVEVENLRVKIPVSAGMLNPVRGLNFEIKKGETLCVVGESGSGKSLSAFSLMKLLPKIADISARKMQFMGRDILKMSPSELQDMRGNRMAMIFQEPMTALNPSYSIGNQLVEVMRRHQNVSIKEATERAIYLLEKVGITAAASRLSQYPHQLSGGLRQRVVIAMALMCGPDLIIADEPTTALDVTIQAQILHLLKELQHEFEMAILLITHDLGVVARMADRVAVMYAGEFVETGTAEQVFRQPVHPYTQGLLSCIPVPGKTARGSRLGSIPGIVPSLIGDMRGCAFRTRCPHANGACQNNVPLEKWSDDHFKRCVLDDTALTSIAKEATA